MISTFPAGPWQANCYVVAEDAGGPCVVIDPGVDALGGVRRLLHEHDLTIAGVVATHGHIDHIASAGALADEAGVPVLIHPDDEHLLTDPLAGIGAEAAPLLEQLLGRTMLDAPRAVEHLTDRDTVHLAGLGFGVDLAPGHTQGCCLLSLQTEDGLVVFTGDVVFAGSIGRMDLPGGDEAAMKESLRNRVLTLPEQAYLLPGHGPATDMAHELARNPYLQPSYLLSTRGH